MSYYDLEIKRVETEYTEAIKVMQSLTEWTDAWFEAADRVAELSDELWLRKSYAI